MCSCSWASCCRDSCSCCRWNSAMRICRWICCFCFRVSSSCCSCCSRTEAPTPPAWPGQDDCWPGGDSEDTCCCCCCWWWSTRRSIGMAAGGRRRGSAELMSTAGAKRDREMMGRSCRHCLSFSYHFTVCSKITCSFVSHWSYKAPLCLHSWLVQLQG